MEKKLWIIEFLLESFLNKNDNFYQKEISKKLNVSLGLVNKTINELYTLGAIEKKIKGFKIIDFWKLLYYFSSIRKFSKDIIYQTWVNEKIDKIESMMPNNITFTCYSAFKYKFNYTPSDYSKVYIYSQSLKELKKRFPPKKGVANLIILKRDEHLYNKKLVSIPLLFADLWNCKEWYSKEFVKELEVKINGILEWFIYRKEL